MDPRVESQRLLQDSHLTRDGMMEGTFSRTSYVFPEWHLPIRDLASPPIALEHWSSRFLHACHMMGYFPLSRVLDSF